MEPNQWPTCNQAAGCSSWRTVPCFGLNYFSLLLADKAAERGVSLGEEECVLLSPRMATLSPWILSSRPQKGPAGLWKDADWSHGAPPRQWIPLDESSHESVVGSLLGWFLGVLPLGVYVLVWRPPLEWGLDPVTCFEETKCGKPVTCHRHDEELRLHTCPDGEDDLSRGEAWATASSPWGTEASRFRGWVLPTTMFPGGGSCPRRAITWASSSDPWLQPCQPVKQGTG